MEYQKHASMQFSKLYTLIADFLELCANHSEKLYSKREIITAQSRNACISPEGRQGGCAVICPINWHLDYRIK